MEAFAKIEQKKKLILGFFAGLIVLSAAIFGGYFYQKQTALAKERSELTATGTVEATSVLASFKVPGRIENLLVDEGSLVHKGQLLATLETRELAAKLSQAKGARQAAVAKARQAQSAVPMTSETVEATIQQCQAKVAQAEAAARNAKQVYDRYVELHKAGAVSDNDFDSVTTKYEQAQAALREAQAALAQAEAARLKVQTSQAEYEAAQGQANQAEGAVQEAQSYLDNSQLKSPMEGYITQKFLESGEMLNAGTPVFEITDLAHTYVKVYISEQKIGRVKLGQKVQITVPAFPNKVFTGKVVWINNAGDFAVKKAVNEQYQHDLRSFEVKIDVPNPDLALKVGMTANVKILED
ncbi:HlyD family secretion protein [Desulfotomaculum nigrificans]|uniref:HlyD family secretion protein n=1 Tax=Desulfotomaculum nigrificans TaxID=1565 RepID=UPI0001FADFA8|nr:HlyD family efflux transporter periplasmic adaptor subunit [Desulfotomaculum nigrificans]